MPIAQIEDLKARVVAYARLVEDMIEQCRSSLVKRTPETLSTLVQNEEPRANELEVELEEECTSLIAQHQPMARELRTILMVLRMTNDLERMADHAVNIAEAALEAIHRLGREEHIVKETVNHVCAEYQLRLARAHPTRLVLAYGDDPVVRLRRAALSAERQELIKLWRDQEIGDEVMHRLERELDLEEARLAH